MKINTSITLNNNIQMPLFGLGVYLSSEGDECYKAVLWALEAGYRLIDTASFYKNEKSVGRAIKDSGIPRNEIFVTTKVWNDDHGYDNTMRAYEKSFENLGLDYIDLYLVHYPVQNLRLKTWKAMERINEEGSTKSIGVSNYFTHHLEELYANCNIPPTVNQIELSPYCYGYRKSVVDYCREKNILVQAYSPLVRTKKFDDPKLVALAEKYQKTPAHILIRWALQEGISVIPKSSKQHRIVDNADVFDFDISAEDMKGLEGFDENLYVCWNPEETP